MSAANVGGTRQARPTVGRPRSFDEATVVDRAVDVFWRHGAVGTTTRILETELGLTQSSIYNAFGSKSGLLERVVDRYVERMDDEVLKALDKPDARLPEVHAFIDEIVAWVSVDQRPGCLLLNLAAECGPSDEMIVEQAGRNRDRVRQSLANALRRSGVPDVDRSADYLLSAVHGFNITARAGAGTDELKLLTGSLHSLVDSLGRSANAEYNRPDGI